MALCVCSRGVRWPFGIISAQQRSKVSAGQNFRRWQRSTYYIYFFLEICILCESKLFQNTLARSFWPSDLTRCHCGFVLTPRLGNVDLEDKKRRIQAFVRRSRMSKGRLTHRPRLPSAFLWLIGIYTLSQEVLSHPGHVRLSSAEVLGNFYKFSCLLLQHSGDPDLHIFT